MCGSRGGGGDRGSGPPEKSQKYRVLSNTGLDPLKITNLRSQHSMLGHHRPASETSFKWRFSWRADDGPPVVLFGSSFPSSKKKKKKKKKKKRCQSWTPSGKTFRIRACLTGCAHTSLIRKSKVPKFSKFFLKIKNCRLKCLPGGIHYTYHFIIRRPSQKPFTVRPLIITYLMLLIRRTR